MYTPPPSAEDLAKMKHLGFTPEDFPDDEIEVWPDNERAYFLFGALGTQWRAGPGGPMGLDYNTLFHKMDRMRLEPEEYEELEGDIRTMEYAALEAIHAKE